MLRSLLSPWRPVVAALVLLCALGGPMAVAQPGGPLWLPGPPVGGATPRDVAEREVAAYWQGGEVGWRIDRGMRRQGRGAYRLRLADGRATVEAATDVGLLYGAYRLLALQQLGLARRDTLVEARPVHRLRVVDHWDNLDGTIERGYAGRSIFWGGPLDTLRLQAYARANASVGLDVVVPDNVNASPAVVGDSALMRLKAIADAMRPYGIRLALAVNFASPMAVGGLATADPADPSVARWWRERVDRIYRLVPDFAGLLVKANSEGQPGPIDYGRTHAEGANMLARALRPHGGVVMWRAFVYSPSDPDRAKQAWLEFAPLDGQFAPNVIIQVKNGPIDFQPREPFSPLFGAMPHTRQMAELQITQEYLGHSLHTAFLAPMWSEAIEAVRAETGQSPCGALSPDDALTAISAVANVGDGPAWCGNALAQANWYAYGRLAWDDRLTPRQIADEWVRLSLPDAPAEAVGRLLLRSREAVVDYMMPLGLHHLFAWGHHYGPEPYCHIEGARPDWMPAYYHRADSLGLGFDRTVATGTGATAQYPERYARLVDDPTTCPPQLLLWFHHVGWRQPVTHRLSTPRGDLPAVTEPLWDALCHHYQHGLDEARAMQHDWQLCAGRIDSATYDDIARRLMTQVRDAQWWKDACLLYFQTFSRLPLPPDVELPVHDLDALRAVHLGISNYECPSPELLNRVR